MESSKDDILESVAYMAGVKGFIFWILCLLDARPEVIYGYVLLSIGQMAIYVFARTRQKE